MLFSSQLKQLLEKFRCAVLNDDQAQLLLADKLRAMAMQHLEKGKGIVATHFRSGNYLVQEADQSQHSSWKNYIKKQKEDGVWGTYIDVTALGESLGCNIVVTPIKNGSTQKPICLYRTEESNTPTIHLYNSDNNHWHDRKDFQSTKGDGNCLFNAIAQQLCAIARSEKSHHSQSVVASHHKPAASYPSRAVTSAPQCSFNYRDNTSERNRQETAIAHQQLIMNTIQKALKPSQLLETSKAHDIYLRSLSTEKQQAVKAQIASDYAYALELACEEDRPINKPSF